MWDLAHIWVGKIHLYPWNRPSLHQSDPSKNGYKAMVWNRGFIYWWSLCFGAGCGIHFFPIRRPAPPRVFLLPYLWFPPKKTPKTWLPKIFSWFHETIKPQGSNQCRCLPIPIHPLILKPDFPSKNSKIHWFFQILANNLISFTV
jgi:hypothetical protein